MRIHLKNLTDKKITLQVDESETVGMSYTSELTDLSDCLCLNLKL